MYNLIEQYAVPVLRGVVIGHVIVYLEDYAERLVRYVHNGHMTFNKKVLLVLAPVGLEERIDRMGCDRLSTLHFQKHTHIVYKSVGSIEDINRAIKTIASDNHNIITGLFISAHGSPDQIALSERPVEENPNSYILTQDVFGAEGRKVASKNIHLLKDSLNKLAPDACIYLESCSTGKITENDNRQQVIAQSLADLAPGRLVIAPVDLCNSSFSAFKWEGERLDVTFKLINQSSKLIEAISSVCASLSIPFSGVKDSITARFKSLRNPNG